MQKEDFDKLDKKKKVEFINNNLSEGISFKEIYDAAINNNEIAKSKETLINQFKKAGYLINKAPQDQEAIAALVMTSEAPENSHRQPKSDNSGQMEKLLNSANDIMQMLEWWKKNLGASESIDDRLNLQIPGGEELRKTIRINSQIWNEWKAFCGKHPGFSEKELLAKALWLYINTES